MMMMRSRRRRKQPQQESLCQSLSVGLSALAPSQCVHVYNVAEAFRRTHTHTCAHALSQMNQPVNAYCLLLECLWNKSCISDAAAASAASAAASNTARCTLLCARGPCRHTHAHTFTLELIPGARLASVSRSRTHADKNAHARGAGTCLLW